MPDKKGESSPDREFLLIEYQRLGDELIANESGGDARAALYATLWTAAVAAVAVYRTSAKDVQDSIQGLLLTALVGLAALGFVVLVRLVNRDIQTDRIIDALSRIRSVVVIDRALAAQALPWETLFAAKSARRFYKPGLVQVVLLLNSGIVAMFAAAALRVSVEVWAMDSAIVIGVIASLQCFYVARRYSSDHAKRTATTFIQ